MRDRPDITPDLTVARLLEHYPETERTLVDLAPAYRKLRNPVLRRTVARVTTLRQAAVVGGISLSPLVNTLRTQAGLAGPTAADEPDHAHASFADEPRPAWLDGLEVAEVHDARPDIEAGRMPLARLVDAVAGLPAGSMAVVVTPFPPAPLIDRLRSAGYRTWTERRGAEEFHTHCAPAATPSP